MSDSPQIIYIAGAAHSGSTLLDLLIGSHSEVQSLGELKTLAKKKEAKRTRVLASRCTCGAPFKLACDFWRAVDARLQTLVGCGLAELDVDSTDPAIFIRHNAALFRAAAEVGGTEWLVDSSKSRRRLARLRDSGRFRIRGIVLSRIPQAIAYSHIRKGRAGARAVWRSGVAELQHAGLAKSDCIPVRYEELVARPAEVLRRVMEALGLVYEDSQRSWSSPTHHTLCGNHMRFATSSEIRSDDAWQTALSPLHKGLVAALGAPMRVLGSAWPQPGASSSTDR